jgi:hypothetical protein
VYMTDMNLEHTSIPGAPAYLGYFSSFISDEDVLHSKEVDAKILSALNR